MFGFAQICGAVQQASLSSLSRLFWELTCLFTSGYTLREGAEYPARPDRPQVLRGGAYARRGAHDVPRPLARHPRLARRGRLLRSLRRRARHPRSPPQFAAALSAIHTRFSLTPAQSPPSSRNPSPPDRGTAAATTVENLKKACMFWCCKPLESVYVLIL